MSDSGRSSIDQPFMEYMLSGLRTTRSYVDEVSIQSKQLTMAFITAELEPKSKEELAAYAADVNAAILGILFAEAGVLAAPFLALAVVSAIVLSLVAMHMLEPSSEVAKYGQRMGAMSNPVTFTLAIISWLDNGNFDTGIEVGEVLNFPFAVLEGQEALDTGNLFRLLEFGQTTFDAVSAAAELQRDGVTGIYDAYELDQTMFPPVRPRATPKPKAAQVPKVRPNYFDGSPPDVLPTTNHYPLPPAYVPPPMPPPPKPLVVPPTPFFGGMSETPDEIYNRTHPIIVHKH